MLTTWDSHKFRKSEMLSWAEKERRELPSWLDKLPACPSTAPEEAKNNRPKPFYHPGAASEVRLSVKGADYGQQCTYDEQGQFIDGYGADGQFRQDTLAPGTADRDSAAPPGLRKNLEFLFDANHFGQDVSWFASARLHDDMDMNGPCTRAYLHARPPPLGDEQPGSALVERLPQLDQDFRDSIAKCRAHGRSGIWRVRLIDLHLTRASRDVGDPAWAFGAGTAFERDSDWWSAALGYRLDLFATPRSDISLGAGLHLGKWLTVGARAHALVSGIDVADTALAVGGTLALRDAFTVEVKWLATGSGANEAGSVEISLSLTPWFKAY